MRLLYIITTILIMVLPSCAKIDNQVVLKDFKQVIINEVGDDLSSAIVDIYSGEGDSDNVYKHIKFNLTAKKDVVLTKGWLKGTSLKKGQILSNGEAVFLYQRMSSTRWKMTSVQIIKVPSPEKAEGGRP